MTFALEELDPRRHDRAGFDCGTEQLNRYLRTLAVQHRVKGIATTFVLVEHDEPATILGYYSLSAATLALERLADADRKGLPAHPIPAVRIGRLAASAAHRGQRLGELLLANAIKRTLPGAPHARRLRCGSRSERRQRRGVLPQVRLPSV